MNDVMENVLAFLLIILLSPFILAFTLLCLAFIVISVPFILIYNLITGDDIR